MHTFPALKLLIHKVLAPVLHTPRAEARTPATSVVVRSEAPEVDIGTMLPTSSYTSLCSAAPTVHDDEAILSPVKAERNVPLIFTSSHPKDSILLLHFTTSQGMVSPKVTFEDDAIISSTPSISGSFSWSSIRADAVFAVDVAASVPRIDLSTSSATVHSLARLNDASLKASSSSKLAIGHKMLHDAVERVHITPKGWPHVDSALFGPVHTLSDITEDDEGNASQLSYIPSYRHGQALDCIFEEEDSALDEPIDRIVFMGSEPTSELASSSIDFFTKLSDVINANQSPEGILREIACLAQDTQS